MKRSLIHRLGASIDRLSDAGGALSGLMVALMALAISYEIVMRALFNMPSTWVLEYSTYGVIAVAFLSAAYTSKLKKHVIVDIVTSRISHSTRTALEFVSHLWSLAFCVIFAYVSIETAFFSFQKKILFESLLQTPLWISQSFLGVGLVILTLQLLKETVSIGMRLRHHGPGDASEKKPFSRVVDRASLLLPLMIGMLALGTLLFIESGASGRAVGLIILLLTMLFTGTPIFLSLGIIGAAGLYIVFGNFSALDGIAITSYKSLSNFTLTCIPLFIMGAGLFTISGLTDKLFDICNVWLNAFRGNLALATIASCAIFACISGSSVATAATIGFAAIPAMAKHGYDEKLACGSVAAGGTLGLLIPPSAMFILYGVLTNTSVGQMFIAGIIPGILITAIFMVYIYLKCRHDERYLSKVHYTWAQKIALAKQGTAIFFTPVLILGGIYTGLFTPTEAAAVAVLYGLLISFIYRKITLRKLITTLRDCIVTSGMVFMIIVGAAIFAYLVTILQIPHDFAHWALGSTLPPWGVVVMIMLLVIVLGMFLECISIQLITLPIVFPAVVSLGFDPIWFGILFCINMELALITPPVGLNLFIITGISGQKMDVIIRGVAPFMVLLLIGMVVLGLFEPLSTWLPSTMYQ